MILFKFRYLKSMTRDHTTKRYLTYSVTIVTKLKHLQLCASVWQSKRDRHIELNCTESSGSLWRHLLSYLCEHWWPKLKSRGKSCWSPSAPLSLRKHTINSSSSQWTLKSREPVLTMSLEPRRSAFIQRARFFSPQQKRARCVDERAGKSLSFSKSQFLIVEERRSALRSPED